MNFGMLYYGHHPAADYFNAAEAVNNTGADGFEAYQAGQNTSGPRPDSSLGIQDIGMSAPMGISAQNVAGIYSKIRMGAGKVEIQFPGYRSGNRQAMTPEMFGEDQRQAFRELQMANEVKLTTHGSFGIMGMMGRDERGNYSLRNSYQDMLEIRRAIDFQADIGGGGSVVVHSGEFERPMTDMYLDDETHTMNLARDPSGKLLVRQYVSQEFDARYELMDDRTDQKMETVMKDRLVAFPVWRRSNEGYEGVDVNGNKCFIKKGDYIDYQDRLVLDPYDPYKGRVPEFDKELQRFKTELRHFDYFKQEANEYNEYKRKNLGREPDYREKVYPEEMFLRATLEIQEGHSRGWALQYGQQAEGLIEVVKKLDKLKQYYEQMDKSIPEEEKWKIMMQDPYFAQHSGGLLPSETKHPLQLIEDRMRDVRKNLEFARQASTSQEQQARDTKETKENIITPIKRLQEFGSRMYAEAGIHAMQKSNNSQNPIAITIENLFPERFGGHLEELKFIVKKSREEMVKLLTEPTALLGTSRHPIGMDAEKLNKVFGYGGELRQENPYYIGVSKEEAERLAEQHIKVTLDTGHLNMWRKFWQVDPKKSQEQNEADYKKWILSQVESLAREGMIGNVHLADNFGYQDDHLAPGQGNSPVKEVVEILKKSGYDGAYTVEPGADASTDQSDFHGLMKTWRHFGTPVYDIGMGGPSIPQKWGDIQYSYFGQNKPPYFIFGNYAPSNEWTMWSQVPLE